MPRINQVSASVMPHATAEGIEEEAGLELDQDRTKLLARGWRAYENVVGTVVGAVARSFGHLGFFIANRPVLTLIISLLGGSAIVGGWARFRLESRSDVLWVPQSGKSHDDGNYVKSTYPRDQDGASFYAQTKASYSATQGDDNVVRLATTWEMFQLHIKIMAITVDWNGRSATFTDLCATVGRRCSSKSYLWYWERSFEEYVRLIDGSLTDATVGNATTFHQLTSATTYPDGSAVPLLSVFGGTVFSFQPTFSLQSAKVAANDYTLAYAVPLSVAEDWQTQFTDLLKAELPRQQYMSYTWITGNSVGVELGKSINGDFMLIAASIIVFIVVTILFLTKCSLVNTRSSLAVLGVGVIALGMMSGWGWGMIFGMPYTSLQMLSPFILLGMGIDVIYIMVKGYDVIIQREPWLPIPAAFRKLMSTAGLSVQVSLLASCVAFSLGSTDRLNSVKWFSAFAALNTLMIMVLMMTLFVACMVLTERRIKTGRFDVFCCWKADKGLEDGPITVCSIPVAAPVSHVTIAPTAMGFDGVVHARVRIPAAIQDDQTNEHLLKKFFRVYYGPVLSKWWIKVPILMFFMFWMGISFYGITKIKYGQPLSDLVPDDSYVRAYDQQQTATYAQQVGKPVGLYFRGMDFADEAVQFKMLRAMDMVLQNEFINASTSGFQTNWYIQFNQWAAGQSATVAMPTNNCYNPYMGKITGQLAGVIMPFVITGCVPKAQFYTLLNAYLLTTSSNQVVFTSPTAPRSIVSCSVSMMQTASYGNDKYPTDLMNSIGGLQTAVNVDLFSGEGSAYGGYTFFMYGSNYLSNEGQQILPEQALNYFMFALLGVGVVCLFMLVNPGAAILMMCAVGLVILFLFCELWVLKIRFNDISIINMIMATGLSIDYNIYFAQKFMTLHADGTGNGRMRQALTDTGYAVFLGGLTALLGTVPMAFAKSSIIRTFFSLIFGTILFSLLVGLVLMPVIFSLLPMPPVRSVLIAAATDMDGPTEQLDHSGQAKSGNDSDIEGAASSESLSARS